MTAQRASEKIALVTGGADGLGTHLVWALARLRYGVVLASPRPDPAAGELVDRIADKGGYSRSMRADIADKVDVAALYASIDQQEGRLDLVVHHLGAGRSTNLRHITPEDWDEALGENLSGVFYSSYHARTLLEEARGQIVNIWNPGALGATGRGAARQVCRDGLVALTASMAEASAPTLRINMISAGLLEDADGTPPDAAASVPLLRAGTFEDVGHALRFLLEASYVTGINVDVAGGFLG